jgi:predicted neuraminidase
LTESGNNIFVKPLSQSDIEIDSIGIVIITNFNDYIFNSCYGDIVIISMSDEKSRLIWGSRIEDIYRRSTGIVSLSPSHSLDEATAALLKKVSEQNRVI